MAISIKIIQKVFALFVASVFFCAVFMFAPSAHAAIIKPANNLGLLGYWNLDEGKGIVAFDHGSGKNNGTLTSGPTWTTGKLGSALTFGAASNYVVASTPWPVNGGSISEWVYPTGYADWISPSGWKLLGTNNGYILIDNGGAGTPGKWRAVFNPNNTTGPGEQDVVALQNDVLNAWTHLTFTWSLSGSTYTTHLYVNGVDQGSATWTGTPGVNGVGNFHFGNSGDFPDNYFQGKIDDVRVYNRPLSAVEAKALYNQTAGTRLNTSSQTLGNGSTLTNGLIGWWTFDGPTISGTTATDSSGAGHSGTLTSGPIKVAGKLGQALNFSGTPSTGSYVSVGHVQDGATAFTWSAWIKTTQSLSPANFFDKPNIVGTVQASGFTNDAELGVYGGKLAFYDELTGGANNVNTGVTVNDGKWHFVGVTRNGTSLIVYADGVAVDTTTTGTNALNSLGFEIAKANWSAANNFFGGSIDDVRIYNRALSAAEMTQLYQEGATKVGSGTTMQNGTTLATGLVGYWPFDGSAVGTTIKDISGNNNNGYAIGAATSSMLTAGKLGQAMKFATSTAQEISVGTAPAALTFAYNQPFSFSLWARPSSGVGASTFSRMISIVASPNKFEYFIIASNNQFVFNVGKNGIGDSIVTSASFTPGVWYHLVGVYDGANLNFYVNGVSVGTAAYTFGALASPDGLFSIGGGGSTVSGFNGSLDEVRVYNRALSAAEVQQLYSIGK